MKTIRVWDIVVRLFHWCLVIAVATQLATAESFTKVHVKVGYFIIGALIVRIIWGFVGSRHARFADFIYPPSEILGYLTGLFKRKPKHYTGHNPAGGAMVCALLFVLALTTLTGLMTYKSHAPSPLAFSPRHWMAAAWADGSPHENDAPIEHQHTRKSANSHLWKEIHESLVGVTIFLVILHICGVIVSSWVHRENLILAMITGNKQSGLGR